MDKPLRSMEIKFERDIVRVHQTARRLADLLQFDPQDQARLATAVSEICRNSFKYAGGGRAEFLLRNSAIKPALLVRVADRGPGISRLSEVMTGSYQSPSGMGLGVLGSRRLMDLFDVDTRTGEGTRVLMGKFLPGGHPLPPPKLTEFLRALEEHREDDPFELIRQQNVDLMKALDQLKLKQEELNQSNRELEETNRGVVALYRELDDKSQALQRANEVKSRFLSHVSHELRTPVYSILALSRILLSRSDGELTPEQEKQISFIRQAGNNLQEMIDELLDLAKIEAGQMTLKCSNVDLRELFTTLRGMLRPLLSAGNEVALNIEDATVERLFTDEGKLAQILRNLISNAIKFTTRGEIVVSVQRLATNEVCFRVRDTGVGISAEHQKVIFDEFVQVEGPHQRGVKGTGLGLPVSRKLAEILGGTLTVESVPGSGSTFSLVLPNRVGHGKAESETDGEVACRILLIDDDEIYRYLCRDILSESGWEVLEANNGVNGVRLAIEKHPTVILLDLLMPGLDGFQVLEQLKARPETSGIPVIINSTRMVDSAEEAILRKGATAVLRKAFSSSQDSGRDLISAVSQAIAAREGETTHA